MPPTLPPFPQPPSPQPPLCQPLPQPPLCQPLPQPPLCQPQPPCQPRQPLPHQASWVAGSTATNGSPSLAYFSRASETDSRIDCSCLATSPGFLACMAASDDRAAVASADARLTEKPKAPAGSNAASARAERRS